MTDTTRTEIEQLVANSRDAVVCSIDEEGFPNAKGMFVARREGLHTLWFSTNTSSQRVQQFLKNDKACVYFIDSGRVCGLMLTGRMQVMTDNKTKASFWSPSDIQYYPQGIADPDYCILRFTAERGNYYRNLEKHLFTIEEGM